MTELLADHTTLRVGGPARCFIRATTEQKLVEVVQECDRRGEPVLVLGGGSNTLVSDDGFDGTVVQVAIRGIQRHDRHPGHQGLLGAAAGESWDGFVQESVGQGLVGLEALSGIPGTVGATPIQNVGAYGQEVSATLAKVKTFDRLENKTLMFDVAECGFGYRTSRFKQEPGRWLILEVIFAFAEGARSTTVLSAPIQYQELASRLGIQLGECASLAEVREAVLALRKEKRMVFDPADHDTWSVGSFFTNPVLPQSVAAILPADAPRYPTLDGLVKTSAAWLIERAGFHKGYGTPPATLSTKHVLALTNRGGARAADIVALAKEIRDTVSDRFGVELVPEPTLVGVSL